MSARFYALRRLNPYRGVVQIADAGDAEARSLDGVTWHLRADDGRGWVRPVGVWVDGEGLKAGVGERYPALLQTLRDRPELPFPLADSIELWLLDKEQGLPLALLDAQRPSVHRHGPVEIEWLPFALPYRGFQSPTLAERDAGSRHASPQRDFLARIVNQRARPYAAAQWFRRHPDGGGEGLTGYRLEREWEGRRLPAAAFPALLVRGDWNSRLEKSVIWDYHAWLSPFLLCWQSIPDEVRRELEEKAMLRPRWLAQVHRLLPRVLDADRLRAALVVARLEAAAGTTDNDLI